MVGGKALGLNKLLKAGAPVPRGFCISTSLFKDFIKQAKGYSSLENDLVLVSLESKGQDKLEIASKKAQELISSSQFSSEQRDELLSEYHKLTENGRPVAVRSSATLEDTASLSFAGQHDTLLNITEENDFLGAVKTVWGSFYTPRAISYRNEAKLGHSPSMAIVVQSMVSAKKSGVLFTVNPSTSDRSKMLIEAVWGLGEGLVGGTVTPDQYFVDKITLEIYKKNISTKKVAYEPDLVRGGVLVRELASEASKSCLSDEETKEIAKMGKAVEKELRQPQDIEWACEFEEKSAKSQIFFLQSRPITTLKQSQRNEKESDVYSIVTGSMKKQFSISKT